MGTQRLLDIDLMVTPWVPCHMCEDWLCNIHEVHVHECECPAIDDWAEFDLDPYSECRIDKVDALLEYAKFEEEFPW